VGELDLAMKVQRYLVLADAPPKGFVVSRSQSLELRRTLDDPRLGWDKIPSFEDLNVPILISTTPGVLDGWIDLRDNC